jgi:hypothetical protein
MYTCFGLFMCVSWSRYVTGHSFMCQILAPLLELNIYFLHFNGRHYTTFVTISNRSVCHFLCVSSNSVPVRKWQINNFEIEKKLALNQILCVYVFIRFC